MLLLLSWILSERQHDGLVRLLLFFSVDSHAECDPDTSTSGSYSNAVKWNKDMSQYQKQDKTVALKIAIEQSMPKVRCSLLILKNILKFVFAISIASSKTLNK
jgi:hypothetical protein